MPRPLPSRTLPLRKTHGTAYNLDPDTERVPAHAIQLGDVVMEGPGHPARIEGITRISQVCYRLWAKYIWQPANDVTWPLGDFDATHPLDRALPGEYPTT